MAFQFPASPVLNDVFTPVPGISFQWNGTGWVPYSTSFPTTAEVAAQIAAALVVYGQTFVGAIYYRHVAQAKELACNGQLISKAGYPDLWTYAQSFLVASHTTFPGGFIDASATHFNLPDLDGQFIRSVGAVVANPAATSGGISAQQASALQGHLHILNDPGHLHGLAPLDGGVLTRSGANPDQGATGSTGTAANTEAAVTGATVGAVTFAPQNANETIPYNTAYYAVIRALP